MNRRCLSRPGQPPEVAFELAEIEVGHFGGEPIVKAAVLIGVKVGA